MNIFFVIVCAVVNFAVIAVGTSITNLLIYGVPGSPFFQVVKDFSQHQTNASLFLPGVVVYSVVLLIIIEYGVKQMNSYREKYLFFCAEMSVFTSKLERTELKTSILTTLNRSLFCFSFLVLGLVETIGSIAFLSETTVSDSTWFLHCAVGFIAGAVMISLSDSVPYSLTLLMDKDMIRAEKRARAMQEALSEEIEDGEQLGF